MHHVFFISELVREVCRAADLSSLPALARTCRALHDPALDELWRDLYTIYPFVHLLTQTAPEETQQPSLRPTSSQWATLRAYSARTRSLYMCMIDDLPCCFPSLSDPPEPDVFFPNVQTVAWYPDNHHAMLPFLRLLCGPALTSLSAEFATDPASLAMLADLGCLCPNISHISISASSDRLSDDLAHALSTSICRWQNLRHVTCDDLTGAAIDNLGRSRHLESLTTCASGRMASFPQSLGLRGPCFAHLRHLHLYTGLLSTATDAIRDLRLALDEFRLDLFDVDDTSSGCAALQDLFTALANTCAHATLARLSLCVVHPHFPPPDATTPGRALVPLLRFTHLRVVALEGVPTLSLTDDDIVALAAAWPHIEDLALATYVNHPVASLPTLCALVHLARACLRLRSLALVVDTGVTSPRARALGAAWPDKGTHVPLDALCLGNSPIPRPPAVAQLLHHLYPALRQVDLSVWNREPLNRLPRRDWYEAGWGRVNVALQDARARTMTR